MPRSLSPSRMKTPRQRGYGLLDVILASVLLLGALAGIIVLSINANLVRNSTRTAQAVITTTAELRGIYEIQGSFADLGADFETGTARVVRMGIVPEDLIVTVQAGHEIMTDFGGESRIRFRANPVNPAFFDVEITNVPRSACIRLSFENDGATGPLGRDYEVVADCSEPSVPIVATYSL